MILESTLPPECVRLSLKERGSSGQHELTGVTRAWGTYVEQRIRRGSSPRSCSALLQPWVCSAVVTCRQQRLQPLDLGSSPGLSRNFGVLQLGLRLYHGPLFHSWAFTQAP